jgi:hypothetical protein
VHLGDLRLAITMYFDVQRWLATHGWRENAEATKRWTHGSDTTYGYIKAYSGVW